MNEKEVEVEFTLVWKSDKDKGNKEEEEELIKDRSFSSCMGTSDVALLTD